MQIPTPLPEKLDWQGYPARSQGYRLPLQVGLPFYGRVVDVDGRQDPTHPCITYWGKAVHVFDDVYHCLADVGGTLCVLEVTIRPGTGTE